MKIQYRKGDLLTYPGKFIAHGCNAQGVMGSGVAALIKKKYPYAYKTYRQKYDVCGLNLGDIQILQCKDKTVINLITQEFYGREPKRYVSYDAIALCMQTLEEYLYGEEIAMPMIGAGLGGGKWEIIEAIIETELKTVQPVVYQYGN